jgi:hypothetical protein
LNTSNLFIEFCRGNSWWRSYHFCRVAPSLQTRLQNFTDGSSGDDVVNVAADRAVVGVVGDVSVGKLRRVVVAPVADDFEAEDEVEVF